MLPDITGSYSHAQPISGDYFKEIQRILDGQMKDETPFTQISFQEAGASTSAVGSLPKES